MTMRMVKRNARGACCVCVLHCLVPALQPYHVLLMALLYLQVPWQLPCE